MARRKRPKGSVDYTAIADNLEILALFIVAEAENAENVAGDIPASPMVKYAVEQDDATHASFLFTLASWLQEVKDDIRSDL